MKMLTKVSNESSKTRHLMSVYTDSHTHTYIHIYTKTVSIFSSKEKKRSNAKNMKRCFVHIHLLLRHSIYLAIVLKQPSVVAKVLDLAVAV